MFPQVYTAEFIMSFLTLAIFGVSLAEYFGVRIKKNIPPSLRSVFTTFIFISLFLATYVFSGIFNLHEELSRFAAYFLMYGGIHYIYTLLKGTNAAFSRFEILLILAVMVGSVGSDFIFTYLQKDMLTATTHALLGIGVVFAIYFFMMQCIIRISNLEMSFVANRIPIYYYPVMIIFVMGSTMATATLQSSLMAKASPARSPDEITFLIPEGEDISMEYAGMLLADELGMYQKRGLHVSFETYNPTLIFDGIRNGYGTFAIVTDVALLRTHEEGGNIIAVTSLFNTNTQQENEPLEKNVLITRSDIVETYPTITQRFIEGTAEGWNWLFDNEEAGLHLLIERLFPGAGYNLRSITRSELDRIIILSEPATGRHFGCHDRSAWSRAATAVQTENSLFVQGDVSTVYTNEFLECP